MVKKNNKKISEEEQYRRVEKIVKGVFDNELKNFKENTKYSKNKCL